MNQNKVNGNISGVKDSLLEELQSIYDLRSLREIVSDEIVGIMARVSTEINKEICVMIARSGMVLDVCIGDSNSVSLKNFNLSSSGLNKVRCIHTHPKGSGALSSVDIGSLVSAKYDAMVAIGVNDGKAVNFGVGLLNQTIEDEIKPAVYGLFKKIPHSALFDLITEAIALNRNSKDEQEVERALLLGVTKDGDLDSLHELEKLCKDCGVTAVDMVFQNRPAFDPAYYMGYGKIQEIKLLCSAKMIDVVICDDELSTHQTKNLEEALGLKIVDRTTLILDIFAKRAGSAEGKLQVELAQQKYRLPRLKGMGIILSRLGGGIGTRGPGEKKLETDRRHIQSRIDELQKKIEEVAKQRELRRQRSVKSEIPKVSLVGYTNAGKSTLLNAMASSDVMAKDQLFATLDPVTRKVDYDFEFLLSDTVGFMNKLPHELIIAFKSTLEQAKYSDVILHVVDITAKNMDMQIETVNKILNDLKIVEIPIIMVYNKCDNLEDIGSLEDKGIYISAKEKSGINELVKEIQKTLFKEPVELVIPYDKGGLQNIVRKGKVIEEEYKQEGIYFKAYLKDKDYSRILLELKKG